MSDIERFIWASAVTPAVGGDWVRYTDHQAEVEQLTRQRSENFAEIERLTRARDGLRDSLREAQAEVKRLKEQVAALTVAVEQADEAKADAEAAAAAEEAETDRVMSERDAAQAEVERLTQELDGRRATNQRIIAERDLAQGERERLQDLLTCERQELSALRDRLRVLQANPSAQNLSIANGQAILDSSRPDDETIWRETWLLCAREDVTTAKCAEWADQMLAQYRKRWPR